jgi:DNA-binding MurR/RpiR family transcriptional regulator
MENIFFEKLKNKHLTKGQRKIAEYFIENEYLISQKSLLEIANEIGTSDASVIRFARILGYDGYADLKNDLNDKMVEQMSGMPLDERFDVNKTIYSSINALNTYMEVIKNNIEKSLKQNNVENYDEVVELLIKSKRKCIIGFRGCKGLALQFASNLRYMIDDVVEIVNDSPNAANILQGLEKDDFIIFFSFVRYYKLDIAISEFAKKNGIKICIITDNIVSPVVKNADLVLKVNTTNISFMNSTVAALCMSEHLLNLLLIKNKNLVQNRLNVYDALTENFR